LSLSAQSLFSAVRFFGHLPFYLHRRLTLDEARRLQAQRLHNRRRRLIDRLRNDIFNRPGSVYSQLFRHAGCELTDVENAINKDGMEATLHRLFLAGVYLTVDEFKGRKPIQRGSLLIQIDPDHLRSPRASYHLTGSSGGSRTTGTPVLMDMRFIRDCASNCMLALHAWGDDGWIKADWESPGAGARFRIVKFSAIDPPQAWFTHVRPDDPSLPSVTRWNTHAMRLAGWISGRPFPAPTYAPLSDPSPAVDWLSSVLASGRVPMLFGLTSSVVRLCLNAIDNNVNIEGARFMIGGEPCTQARLDTIRRAGAIPIPRYGSMETGAVAYSCPNAEHCDESHLLTDMHVVIQAGDTNPAALPPPTLLLTVLHPRSPFLMLNLSMGDQAEITSRPCGCPLYDLGWTSQLHTIRSFEKLTGGGVTFLGTDVIPLLEEFLPARFGGQPTDYQLVEEESESGQPILRLMVHPSLGPLDEAQIAEAFLSQLATGPAPAARMIQMWRDSNTFHVSRRPPVVSRAGKILHLHRQAL